jgi:hypothetical protein
MGAVRQRGYSGESSLSNADLLERDRVMAVALAQPHRIGVSAHHDDAWMASALGRFCRVHWRDKGTQHDRWNDGERYAQLIDAERISRGLTPRQCAESSTAGSQLTLEEMYARRSDASHALRAATEAMFQADPQAPRAVRDLAWEDQCIPARLNGRAYHGLYLLSVHFERLDKPKSVR